MKADRKGLQIDGVSSLAKNLELLGPLDVTGRSFEPLVNEFVAARLLGDLAVATLRRWRWAGRGPSFVRIGRAVRYDPLTLRQYIRDHTHQSTSEGE